MTSLKWRLIFHQSQESLYTGLFIAGSNALQGKSRKVFLTVDVPVPIYSESSPLSSSQFFQLYDFALTFHLALFLKLVFHLKM